MICKDFWTLSVVWLHARLLSAIQRVSLCTKSIIKQTGPLCREMGAERVNVRARPSGSGRAVCSSEV